MNPSRALLALHALPLAQRRFLVVAAVVAVALLSLYVQLLHLSLVRGDELRAAQRNAGITKLAKTLPHPPQAAVVGEKNGPERTAARTR